MQHWGYKEESSTGYSCVAALKKFGLAEHEGMGENAPGAPVATLALTILLDNDPGSAARAATPCALLRWSRASTPSFGNATGRRAA